MRVCVRPAVLEIDRGVITDLHRRCLSAQSPLQRFDWLYSSGPHGTARAWVAYEEERCAAVGTAAAFPRKVYVDGVERFGWVLGDFCFDQEYRTLGPALQLQRECLRLASEVPFEFCYDFPSSSMMAVYRRLGVSQTSAVVRWAKPLRLEPRLGKFLGSMKLAGKLAAVGNEILVRRGWKGEENTCDLVQHQGACGDEFDALNRLVRKRSGMFTARTAAYLNWRYLANPLATYEILCARQNKALIGYAVFTGQGDARIVDLCSLAEPAVIARLLRGVIDLLAPRGMPSVSMTTGKSHPWSAVFERCGFQRREESPFIVHFSNGASSLETMCKTGWHLMEGERDC